MRVASIIFMIIGFVWFFIADIINSMPLLNISILILVPGLLMGIIVSFTYRSNRANTKKKMQEVIKSSAIDADKEFKCPDCNYPVYSNYKKCPKCGIGLKFKFKYSRCTRCAMKIEEDFNICPFCGKKRKITKEK